MADILDVLLIEALPALIAIQRWPPNNQYLPNTSVCEDWDDAQILEHLRQSDYLPNEGRILTLCNDTVAKVSPRNGLFPESLALDFIRSNTTIPVPRVRRNVPGYMILEKIEGTRLDEVWPSLSPSEMFFVALTLRGYVAQLRQASMYYTRRHIPGPLGDAPQYCTGCNWLFSHRNRGPFLSSGELLQFCNNTYRTRDVQGTFPNSAPLVLTHMDLSPRNIIVGAGRRLWLVDFEWAGFYPPWFERLAMMSAAKNDSMNMDSWMNKPGAQGAAGSWWRYIPFITGTWEKEITLHGYGKFKFDK